VRSEFIIKFLISVANLIILIQVCIIIGLKNPPSKVNFNNFKKYCGFSNLEVDIPLLL